MKGNLTINIQTDENTDHMAVVETVFKAYNLPISARFVPLPIVPVVVDMLEIEAKSKNMTKEQIVEQKKIDEAALLPKI